MTRMLHCVYFMGFVVSMPGPDPRALTAKIGRSSFSLGLHVRHASEARVYPV
jgi:hypothetical protein